LDQVDVCAFLLVLWANKADPENVYFLASACKNLITLRWLSV